MQSMGRKATTARAIALLGLEIALAYAAAAVHEEGGNNRGDQVEFFQRLMGGAPGDPWCADFVCTCLVKGYARHTGQDESRPMLSGYVPTVGRILLPLSGYCPALAQAARAGHGGPSGGGACFRPPDFAAEAGDLALFDFAGAGEPHHVGFVCSSNSLRVRTVEGNTSPAGASSRPCSQADGDGVFLRSRPRTHVFGFVHFY